MSKAPSQVAVYIVLSNVLRSRGYTIGNPPKIVRLKAGVWRLQATKDGGGVTRWCVYLGHRSGEGWRVYKTQAEVDDVIARGLGENYDEHLKPLIKASWEETAEVTVKYNNATFRGLRRRQA